MLYNKIKKYLSDNSLEIDKIKDYIEFKNDSDDRGDYIYSWDASKVGIAKPSDSVVNNISEKDSLKPNTVELIKSEASRRIEVAYPEYKQRNFIAQVTKIQNKEIVAMKTLPLVQYKITAEELQILKDADACENTITAIRAKSNQLEVSLSSMTLAEIKTFDPTNDKHWK